MIKKDLLTYDISDKEFYKYDVTIDEPRLCNHCNNTGEQIFLSGVLTESNVEYYNAIGLFKCFYCEAITTHFLNRITDFRKGEYYFSVDAIPKNTSPINTELSLNETIQLKFKNFVEIYQQAAKAEEANLDKIAGMGYRKALEFLVTDFLIQYPTSEITEEWLTDPKTTLGAKIEKFSNERIKKLAKAISFLGNDETHYTRRHPEHDTESIKMFIKALLSDVENEIILIEAEELLNKPK